jgi:hypothetical protein
MVQYGLIGLVNKPFKSENAGLHSIIGTAHFVLVLATLIISILHSSILYLLIHLQPVCGTTTIASIPSPFRCLF